MRRLVWTVVVLAVLAGGAYLVDSLMRDQAEQRVAAEVEQAIPGVEQPPDVTIEGFPFLTQVAAGELSSVRLAAPAATVDGLRLEDVVVRVHGVGTTAPYTAETAEMTALVTPDAAEAALGLSGLDLGVRDGELIATASALGLPLDVAMSVRAEGQEVVVDVVGFVLGGFRVDSGELPAEITAQLQGLRIAITGLPATMNLTGATVVDDGIRLEAAGADLALSAAG
ncbi:LmeA family phospholipid-binding protein [Actinotalea fermentans]|uniref:DUF2993 domain-containing protein n=1 Tax=Actinotalea fermentans TaxID=43671 RepID=A0A511YZD6_9CELL|nr:DUF2993 domain-containing protein [Actinotalea fermentans]KGM15615.1 hypothetical protein N867_07000 [Actinotalea fermentans ATCC 43279 = JCM 9966 = DSM 3133]GEN80563.1 hypothetical protein AFE02nite_22970 [Actinotalea fermentans]